MEDACRGARAEGGLTIGVIPGDDRKSANSYVQIPIVTGIGYARNVIIVKSAQAVIAVGGGYGTLTEIGYALDGKIPVIGIIDKIMKNGSNLIETTKVKEIYLGKKSTPLEPAFFL